jgi:hypothetical protein
MRQNRMKTAIAAVIGGSVAASLLLTSPAGASPAGSRTGAPRVPGPCALTRLDGEEIEGFSIRMITCATDRWPVPGGAEKAICIAERESGLIPWASSPTGMYVGLFQHSAEAWPDRYDGWAKPFWELKRSPLNGRTNSIVTIRMVNDAGWGPWAGTGC